MNQKKLPYRICSRCILDTHDDPYMQFDEQGICSSCKTYDERVKTHVYKGKVGEAKIKELVNEIKESGKNKKFDCIITLYCAKSGGARRKL